MLIKAVFQHGQLVHSKDDILEDTDVGTETHPSPYQRSRLLAASSACIYATLASALIGPSSGMMSSIANPSLSPNSR